MRIIPGLTSRRLFGPLLLTSLLLAACATAPSGPSKSDPATPSTSPIVVTIPPNCPNQPNTAGLPNTAGSIDLFPIGEPQNGKTYQMVPCQAIEVTLYHPALDGCRWSFPKAANPKVLAILPLPLHLLPGGGTVGAFIAKTPGQTTLSSVLVCANKTTQAWTITVLVHK